MATREERIAELTARLGVLELPTEKELLAEILAELRPDNRSELQKARDALEAHRAEFGEPDFDAPRESVTGWDPSHWELGEKEPEPPDTTRTPSARELIDRR